MYGLVVAAGISPTVTHSVLPNRDDCKRWWWRGTGEDGWTAGTQGTSLHSAALVSAAITHSLLCD